MIKQMVEEENVSTDLYPGERLTTADVQQYHVHKIVDFCINPTPDCQRPYERETFTAGHKASLPARIFLFFPTHEVPELLLFVELMLL